MHSILDKCALDRRFLIFSISWILAGPKDGINHGKVSHRARQVLREAYGMTGERYRERERKREQERERERERETQEIRETER